MAMGDAPPPAVMWTLHRVVCWWCACGGASGMPCCIHSLSVLEACFGRVYKCRHPPSLLLLLVLLLLLLPPLLPMLPLLPLLLPAGQCS